MSVLAVIAVGTKVDIGPADSPIEGSVIGVQIRSNDALIYEVAWWNGRSREEKWVDETEVRLAVGEAKDFTAIGFISGNKS
jgi:hypothetical protein